MPEELSSPAPQPEAPALIEADMDRLAGEILKHKENPEMAGAGDREIVKQALRALAPQPATAGGGTDDANAPYLPNYVQSAPPATKLEIEFLLETAFKEGLAKANALASKSSPFVLDAFHDALAGKLYPELQKRKLVE